jgi:integrase
MSKIDLKYVQTFSAGGQRYHYFRRRGVRVRLPGIIGSAEFMGKYAEVLALSTTTPTDIGASTRSKVGSVSAAIAEYYGSQAFRSLGGGTAAKWRANLERFRERHGHMPLGSLPKEFVVALFDTLPPHAALNWLKTFRHFFRWCLDRKLVRNDPTLGIRLKMPKSDGHHTWTETEITAFEAHHPIGSKPRLALALGLYTAQRRGDVVKLGRQHIRNGVLTVRQEKTGATLTIPVHPDLAAIIAATPIGHLTLLTTNSGKSYGGNDFTDQFRAWCDAAGLPDRCVFHGLRKAACTRLADAGCTVHEIAAISGHKTLSELERYTKAANQARLARSAMERIGNQSVKPVPDEVSKPLSRQEKKLG